MIPVTVEFWYVRSRSLLFSFGLIFYSANAIRSRSIDPFLFLTLSVLSPISSLSNFHPSGGLETIFNGEKQKKLQVEAVARRKRGDDDDSDGDDGDEDNEPSTSTTTVARVAAAAAALADPAQAHMLFVKAGNGNGISNETETVRPGVLVLVNDADWELCGGARARVAAGDRVTFISTLHGG